MREARPIWALICVTILASACVDQQITPPMAGRAVAPAPGALANGNRFDEGGCAVWARDGEGVTRGMAIPRRMLPFSVRPIRRDPTTGRTTPRVYSIRAATPDGAPVTMECLMDGSLSVDDIAAALSKSKSGRWRAVLSQLRTARELPDSGRWQRQDSAVPYSPAPAERLSAGVSMQQGEETCAKIELVFQYTDSDGFWNSATITFWVCYDTGGSDGYAWMVNNGYTQSSYVVVDADRYNIQQTDSVRFFADIVTSSYEIPYLLGWTWTPASGVSDRWTKACADNGYQCKTMVHGSGRIAFDVLLESEQLVGTVQINASAPSDVGNTPGDADFADGPAGYAFRPIQISAKQSTAILADALGMGEWTYTQGCAQCAGGPYTEPPVNIPQKFGDCTDFVWIAVKHVLGTSWPHAKLSTRMFNSYSSGRLAHNGYVQVDSASVRQGDIVVRTTTSGCLCGHAGVFVGWAAGGRPIGHANNGLPATRYRANEDKLTKKFDFKAEPGQLTKFFRPVL